MDLELAGKGAIVTGGGSGIGRAVVGALVSEGMKVVLLDRDDAAGEEAARSAGGPDRVRFLHCDLGDRDAISETSASAVAWLDGLNVLVNSAGIQTYGSVLDTPDDVWDQTLAINLTAAFLVSKHCVPHIRRSGGGAVVNVASVQAFAAQRNVAAYATSKGGLVQLSRAMAVDLAPDVRVNCVCPGSVDTPMLRNSAAQFPEPETALHGWGAMHPMGRIASAAEVADVIVFLASPRAGFTTGLAYIADGGLMSILR